MRKLLKWIIVLVIVILLTFTVFSYIKVELLTLLHISEFERQLDLGTSIALKKVFSYNDSFAKIYVVASRSSGICKQGYFVYFISENHKWQLVLSQS